MVGGAVPSFIGAVGTGVAGLAGLGDVIAGVVPISLVGMGGTDASGEQAISMDERNVQMMALNWRCIDPLQHIRSIGRTTGSM